MTSFSFGQKKKISAETYDAWNKIESVEQSYSGNWVAFEVTPLEGDGHLWIKSTTNETARMFSRGSGAHVHFHDAFIVFTIQPQHDTIRQLKLEKAKKSMFPNDTLGIYWTQNDSVSLIPNITSYKATKEGDWLAYLSAKDLRPKPKKKKKKFELPETTGKTLFIYNPISKKEIKIHRVTEYAFDRSGRFLAYVSSFKGKADSLSVHVIDLSSEHITTLIENQLSIKEITFDYAGKQLLYYHSLDTGTVKNYSLSYWSEGKHNSRILIDSTTKNMPTGWTISPHYNPSFSRNGKTIFCGTNVIEYPEPKDTLLEAEKAKVDIWSGEDLRIQPEQLNMLKTDEERSYLGVYHLETDKYVQIADKAMYTVQTYNHGNANFGLGIDNLDHRRERTWEYPWKSDYYLVNLKSGQRTLIKEDLKFGGSLAPSGQFFMWFNSADSSWMCTDLLSKKDVTVSAGIDALFASDLNGQPTDADPESTAGWTMYEGEEYFAVNDVFDIWFLNPNNPSKSFCLTNGKGKAENMKFSIWRTETDSAYFSLTNSVIWARNEKTKDESIYGVSKNGDQFELSLLLSTNEKFLSLDKAKESDKVLLRKMNFVTYPDLESTDMTFKTIRQLSDVNPQQSDYNWGTVEFVDWTAYDSTELRGLLYKPEDFDSTKSYPMIVYYYEMYQDNVHNYYAPKPTASIVYPTEYVSNGYLIFIPDIRYEPGHPAQSAYNCIMSGTESLIRKNRWIDSTRLGLQGQSWGGYQTAQLITMTDRFKAAMAGAPVSNMISAYGGIRWGSGLSRMFQYERTQSRIGFTIWERPDLYIENSPIFHLPKVTTPLLIMHNDNDGAVPWYQGIELYMGLRRLDKTVWLLNYNHDHHNLTRLPNKRDLSIRMRQFFDHYLLDAPMPLWMKNGLPAIDKGVRTGYELEK